MLIFSLNTFSVLVDNYGILSGGFQGQPPMKSRFLAFACGFFLASNNFGWSSGHRFCETDVQAYAYITLGL